MGRRWEDVRRARLSEAGVSDGDAYRAGYERARRAFELGEQIRGLREAMGITQGQLAERAGTSQPAIARLEAGGVEPKLDTLDRISLALGVDLIVRFEAPGRAGWPPTSIPSTARTRASSQESNCEIGGPDGNEMV